jgi:hypothetical protein
MTGADGGPQAGKQVAGTGAKCLDHRLYGAAGDALSHATPACVDQGQGMTGRIVKQDRLAVGKPEQ